MQTRASQAERGGVVVRPSLRARAIRWLAQREHSRSELRRKLMPHALAEASQTGASGASAGATVSSLPVSESDLVSASASASGPASEPESSPSGSSSPAPLELPVRESAAVCVEAVLDWLEAHGYLSADRFIASRIHAREARFGNLRIRHEIEQHGLVLAPADIAALQDSELSRARAALTRRYRNPPADAAERARRGRFLAGRGFSFEVIGRVLRERRLVDEPPHTGG